MQNICNFCYKKVQNSNNNFVRMDDQEKKTQSNHKGRAAPDSNIEKAVATKHCHID